MCKVVINNSNENVDFIIYNHLFSHENYDFTIRQLLDELHQYNLDLTQDFIQREVNELVRAGLLSQKLKSYSVCAK